MSLQSILITKEENTEDNSKAPTVNIGGTIEQQNREENMHLASQINIEHNENYMNTMSHSGTERDIKCPYCCKSFITHRRMQCHLSLTHKFKKYYLKEVSKKIYKNIGFACDICGKEMANGTSLKRHHLTHHASDEEKNLARKYTCISCQKRFYTKEKLDTHAYIHSDSKTFRCDNCSVYFKTADSLRIHINRKHLGKLYKNIVIDRQNTQFREIGTEKKFQIYTL